MTKWLSLEEPLNTEYRTFKNTGLIGLGDSSKYIFKKNIEKYKGHRVGISHELRKKVLPAIDVYNSAIQQLSPFSWENLS